MIFCHGSLSWLKTAADFDTSSFLAKLPYWAGIPNPPPGFARGPSESQPCWFFFGGGGYNKNSSMFFKTGYKIWKISRLKKKEKKSNFLFEPCKCQPYEKVCLYITVFSGDRDGELGWDVMLSLHSDVQPSKCTMEGALMGLVIWPCPSAVGAVVG